MDAGKEIARAKWLLLAVLVFLVSGCLSWGEFVYLIGGKTADATVTKVVEVTSKRWGVETGKRLEVTYTFTEPDGTPRTGTDTADLNWPIPVSKKTLVQYTPGKDGGSRLSGKVNWIALTVFGVAVAAIGLTIVLFVRKARAEANDD